MTWIKTKIIIFPSDVKTGILVNTYINEIHKSSKFVFDYAFDVLNQLTIESIELRGYKCQNLYFISDDEIKEGDWCLNKRTNQVFKTQYSNEDIKSPDRKKIIATTDLKLINQNGNMMYKSDECDLPQPSQDFIKQYCETGGIDEVEIEYINHKKCLDVEHCNKPCSILNGDCKEIIELKINPDNTINVRMIKDSYSREEVESLIQKYRMYVGITDRFDLASCNNWIKENLSN